MRLWHSSLSPFSLYVCFVYFASTARTPSTTNWYSQFIQISPIMFLRLSLRRQTVVENMFVTTSLWRNRIPSGGQGNERELVNILGGEMYNKQQFNRSDHDQNSFVDSKYKPRKRCSSLGRKPEHSFGLPKMVHPKARGHGDSFSVPTMPHLIGKKPEGLGG